METWRILETVLNTSFEDGIQLIVYENGPYFSIHAPLPHIKPETVQVFCGHRYLTVVGKTMRGKSFKHVVRLPLYVKKNEVYAEFSNGVLDIKVPKDE